MSLKAWARHREPVDRVQDIALGLLVLGACLPFLTMGVTPSKAIEGMYDIRPQGDVARLMSAIGGQESGGDYSAKNASGSGATGAFQVMEENIPSWSKECLGRTVSVSDFHNSPDLQQQVAACKMGQYWEDALSKANGDKLTACKRVAAQWYSGDPDLYTSTAPQSWNGNSYPSISEYASSVCSHF